MELSEFSWEIVWRLLCAVGLGGVIGLDREIAGKAAGLRTHMMVALGAAAFTLAALKLIPGVSISDPARIITGVATGIGFLGAGSIMKGGGEVEGITTAAGIWVVGSVGVACGVGAYMLAFSTTLLAALILVILGRVERISRKRRMRREQHRKLVAADPAPDQVTGNWVPPSMG
ncbi:MAG: MgtC/SapB family protein [Bryobacteraceae bacterium]|nr:MgtC/SapB family protein [Bryobacteraceae bacterium]